MRCQLNGFITLLLVALFVVGFLLFTTDKTTPHSILPLAVVKKSMNATCARADTIAMWVGVRNLTATHTNYGVTSTRRPVR
jgi:hypothetical protein